VIVLVSASFNPDSRSETASRSKASARLVPLQAAKEARWDPSKARFVRAP
jgi:hypothetical protein